MTGREKAPLITVQTLALGCLGAGLFWLIGFPAPVLTGPAAIVSIASIAGLPVHIPPVLRDTCFLLIGLSIGSTVTPEVIATARAWPLSLVALSATLLASLLVVRRLLQRRFGYGRVTALLASAPGHLSYVLGLSAELRADVGKVAVVQSVRVLLLTLLVPLIIALTGAEGTSYSNAVAPLGFGLLAALAMLALLAGGVFKRLGVPAPLLIGGIVVSALGHGSDLTPGSLPPWMTLAAFIIMGALIGTRFDGMGRADVLGALGAGVLATVVCCLFAALGAALASVIVGLPPAALLLAFAPGGIEVMAALAVETGLEPAFVAAHHVFRLMFLTVAFPMLVTRERRFESDP